MKPHITRDLLYSIARHSNWRAGGIEAMLRSAGIYASARNWATLVRALLLGAGISFLVAGVVFFFAYNWAAMHKFLKLGLLQALVLGVTAYFLLSRRSEGTKNLLLTGNTVLVGVLFAVFGQIYQTGANAYDFFLGWTCCVALWVVVAKYPPLWLLFMALVNTTLILYAQQVATHWPFAVLLDLLFVLNAATVLAWEALTARGSVSAATRWFPRVFALAAVTAITLSMVINTFETLEEDRGLCFLLAAAGYAAGIWHGHRARDLFYLSAIPFSGIVVAASLLARLSDKAPELFLLLIGLFVIGATTLLVHGIIRINNKWHGKH
ncbi:DUF2157 domain-containing protein [Pontibacter russatus]|uniref:DUF2157 domain-containing protein n=1 Tax=Pontibacter russatus TaxID=2694929 RepID=UPI00137AAE00|nr:DUF2157 domain-containing protein [Pontibacter russatus]